MAGFENDILLAKNVNFNQGAPPNAGIITSDGQLLIGSSVAPFIRAGSLTSSNNSITWTFGAGTISGIVNQSVLPFTKLPWTDKSSSFAAEIQNGYFISNTATATLPSSPSQGDTISFIVDTTNVLTITANTGQVIRLGSAVSAAAGTCASNARGDAITLTYRSSGTAWIASGPVGTWTIT